jgi:hypothetical protein
MFLERGWLGFPRRRDLAQCDTEVVLGALEIAASAATLWWARIARRKSDLGHNRLRASQSSRRGKYPGARPSQSLSVATLIGRPYRVTKLLNPFEFIAGFSMPSGCIRASPLPTCEIFATLGKFFGCVIVRDGFSVSMSPTYNNRGRPHEH